jgi:hypothetical protein
MFLAPVAATAAEAETMSFTYEGEFLYPGTDKPLRLQLERDLLVKNVKGKKVAVGWRYTGFGHSGKHVMSLIAGASKRLGTPDAASSEVELSVYDEYELVARIEGRFDTSGWFFATWRGTGKDTTALPCTLRLLDREEYPINSEVLLPGDETEWRYYEVEFVAFWNRFRDAVRRRDREEVAGMIQFPCGIMSCMADAWEDMDGVQLDRATLLKDFDLLFDAKMTRVVTGYDPLLLDVNELSGRDYPGSKRLPKETLIYTLAFNPKSEFSRIFFFARVRGAYRIIGCTCVG